MPAYILHPKVRIFNTAKTFSATEEVASKLITTLFITQLEKIYYRTFLKCFVLKAISLVIIL